MKYLDEYRDPARATVLLERITRRTTRPWVLMEICGGQTHTLVRYGIPDLLPANVELIHGPGCPVCVTPLETVDQAIHVASQPGVIFISYGDMLRVPGSRTDLLRAKAAGADVRVAYSPMDAVRVARENPAREVVFFAIGFETTAPANGMAVLEARRLGLRNFSILASHALVPPAVELLLNSHTRTNGLIAPGHVCTVMGTDQYADLSRRYRIPIVVGGFEPVDLLHAIDLLIAQLETGRAELENAYGRSVSPEGNPAAKRVIAQVFQVEDRNWRGIGTIPRSGLRLRPEFAAFDAASRFDPAPAHAKEPSVCIAADILQGLRRPADCPAFGAQCTPDSPLGAPMVSGEGACAAYYRYRRIA